MNAGAEVVLETQGLLQRYHFLVRKLHSLTGLIPVGVFFMFHLYENAAIFGGAQSWTDHTGWIMKMPLIWFVEIFGLALPILFHGIFGLWIVYTAQPNLDVYGTRRNYYYFVQRLTGVLAFVFLLVHVSMTRIYGLFIGEHVSVQYVINHFDKELVLAFYIVGVLASAFHFGNGLWNMGISWGIAQGKYAQKMLEVLGWAVTIGFGTLGVAVAITFYLL